MRKDTAFADIVLPLMKQLLEADEQGRIGSRLSRLADVICGLPEISEAILVAHDRDGEPLAAGSGPTHRDEINTVEALSKIAAETLDAIEDPDSSYLEGRGKVFIHRIERGGTPRGVLIVGTISREMIPQNLPDLLKELDGILYSEIDKAIRDEELGRMTEIRKLVQSELGKERADPQAIARRLREIFSGEAATIFVHDQEKLRLSVSTDESLGTTEPVVYTPGQGLTGHVFKSEQPLRLKNIHDKRLLDSLGIRRKEPLHPDLAKSARGPLQFLGVPMRYHAPKSGGTRTNGVIRISRCGGSPPFSMGDQEALQFFADLMGAYLRHLWELTLSRSIMASDREAICVTKQEIDEEGKHIPRIIFVNPGAEKLVASSKGELIGKDARELYVEDSYNQVRGKVLQAWRDGKKEISASIAVKIRSANGDIHMVSMSVRILVNKMVKPLPGYRTPLYIIGIMRDISDEELSKEHRQRLLGKLNERGLVYYRTDQAGLTVESTESGLTGYSQQELIGKHRKNFWVDKSLRKNLLDEVRRHGGVYHTRQRLRKKNRDEFWADGELWLLHDFAGNEVGVEGIYQDVTDRLLLQAYADAGRDRILLDHELLDELKKSVKYNIDYLSTLGHQLQSPLVSIVRNLKNFKSSIIDSKTLQERLPYFISEASLCTMNIRNLTQMDKILRGESLEKKMVHFSALVSGTTDKFTHLLTEKSIDLKVDKESIRRSPSVRGQTEMLRQVLMNLLNNAIQYSFPHTKVKIWAEYQDGRPCLLVSSHGIGVSEEDRVLIFKRGYRAKRARGFRPNGTGLGLWVVTKVLEAHDATIQCETDLEGTVERTCFRVSFPPSFEG